MLLPLLRRCELDRRHDSGDPHPLLRLSWTLEDPSLPQVRVGLYIYMHHQTKSREKNWKIDLKYEYVQCSKSL